MQSLSSVNSARSLTQLASTLLCPAPAVVGATRTPTSYISLPKPSVTLLTHLHIGLLELGDLLILRGLRVVELNQLHILTYLRLSARLHFALLCLQLLDLLREQLILRYQKYIILDKLLTLMLELT